MIKTVVTGIQSTVRDLNKQLKKIEDKTLAGMYAAGLAVQREAQKRTPVEYGNLRASAYTQKVGKKAVEIGFTASYAIFVHENLNQKLKGAPRPSGLGRYWGPQGEPKFLVNALNATDVVGIVAKYAKGL